MGNQYAYQNGEEMKALKRGRFWAGVGYSALVLLAVVTGAVVIIALIR